MPAEPANPLWGDHPVAEQPGPRPFRHVTWNSDQESRPLMTSDSPATGPRRSSLVMWMTGSLLWLAVLATAIIVWRKQPVATDAPTISVTGGEQNPANYPLWDEKGLPDFTLTSSEGKTVTKQDLLGQPWVTSFIFTRCRDTCPRITQSMLELSRRFRDEPVRLVPITVDPLNDTPEVLADYATANQADSEQWVWLTGPQTALYDLIQQGFRMPVQEMQGEERKPGFEVAHSNNLLLVDSRGVVRGKYNGLVDAEMTALRRDLRQLIDAEQSAGASTASQTGPTILEPRDAEAEEEKPLWNPAGVGDFTMTSRTGETITRDDLLGHPWAVCFVFTRCAATCPRLSTEMAELHQRFRETDALFVSLTVDPEYDTPEVLKNYAEIFSAGDNWLFLGGDKIKTYELIRDSFYLPVKEITGPDRKPGFEVLHSNYIMLIDRQGKIRGRYNGMKEGEVADLRRHLRSLVEEGPRSETPEAGEAGDAAPRKPVVAPRPAADLSAPSV